MRRKFGALSLPILGQGTWDMEKNPRESIRALQRGIDLGLTHIDTAEMYGAGQVEEIVGQAVRGRRDRVFLATKVLPSNATFDGTLQACDRSLARLGVEAIDLYLLHWRESVTLAETFRAFDRLLRDGKIRAFGVSNFDVGDLEEAWEIDRRIACNQVLYHLGERAIERQVLPWCEERRVAVVAYSPFGSGHFPEKNRTLLEVAGRIGATPRQVALAYLTRRPAVLAIPKSARIEHVEENARLVNLSDSDAADLDRAFPPGPAKPLPMI